MSYSDLLQNDNWIKKSNSIIQRDYFRCQECNTLGYHSRSLFCCKDSTEIDRMFSGWKFNEHSISSFIDNERESFQIRNNLEERFKSFSVRPCDTINDESIILDGYKLFRLGIFSRINKNAYCYCKNTPTEMPIYDKHIIGSNTDEINRNSEHRFIISCQQKRLKFTYGNLYIFESDLFDDYVISFENIDKIVLNISYKNFTVSFYFEPEKIKGLNVHHKYYVKGKSPWEYSDEALITLCEDCHKKAHQSAVPIFYRAMDSSLYKNTVICNRCSGSGYIPKYSHVEHGICFDCWGEGVQLKDL